MITAKLLILDDASTILSLVENLFKRKYEVIKCRSVKEAKEALGQTVPDIIITDLNMPDMSGEDFISHLKSKEEWSAIPIIVLSSTENTNTKLKLLRMGVDDFVQKPFNPEELSIRMENILRRSNKQQFVD